MRHVPRTDSGPLEAQAIRALLVAAREERRQAPWLED